MLEIGATVMMYKNGMAICEDSWGKLWYTEIPKESAWIAGALLQVVVLSWRFWKTKAET